MKENFKEKIEEIIKEKDECILSAIGEESAKAFVEDNRTMDTIGEEICNAFLRNDANAMLKALCNCTMEDILKSLHLVGDPDERLKGILEDMTENILGGKEDSDEDDKCVYINTGFLANILAECIIAEGTQNTTSGNWIVYFDEIKTKMGVEFEEGDGLIDAIVEALRKNSEKVAEVSVENDSIDVTYYLDYCPNVEEDIRENI